VQAAQSECTIVLPQALAEPVDEQNGSGSASWLQAVLDISS
jgi:hypothetical protein